MESKWKSIGKALRLKPSELESIAADCKDVKSSMDKVLTKWLNQSYNVCRFGPPSWKLLVAAVAHPNGGDNHALAEWIAQKYNGKWYVYSQLVHQRLDSMISEPFLPPPSLYSASDVSTCPITLLLSPHSVSVTLVTIVATIYSH